MEWISIETKWREMTRRLQNTVPLAAGESTASGQPAPNERKSSVPTASAVVVQLDERALA